MHIGFRTSGGRGEYEVVGSHSGYTAASLEGWEFYMRWPDGTVRETGLWLDPGDSGKPRLRSLNKQPLQIGRIMASMLMLPDPTRSLKDTPLSLPIAVAKQYSLTQVGFGPESEFTGVTDRVTFVPSWVEIANQGGSEAIGVEARWERVLKVYEGSNEFAPALRASVEAHRDYLASGVPVDIKLMNIVTRIAKDLSHTMGRASFDQACDPLSALEHLLGIITPDEPGLPPPDELSEDEPEINVRSAHQWRLAKIRGNAGRIFSRKVRLAYCHRCAFCGATFGALEGIRSGVDAAHILAWSKHDLDVVSNGLALCKLHHWAFDAGIMLLRKEGDHYVTRFTTFADQLDAESLARIGIEGQRIPTDWLPHQPSERPSEKYLKLAYADLGVTFKASL